MKVSPTPIHSLQYVPYMERTVGLNLGLSAQPKAGTDGWVRRCPTLDEQESDSNQD